MKVTRRVFISFCMLLLVLILAACEQPVQSKEHITVESEPSHENIIENEQLSVSYSFKNPNTGQEFNIIHAYMLYDNYFDKVNDNPDESSYELYQQAVIEPLNDACFKGAEYYKYSVFEWTPAESDFNRIKNQIKYIDQDRLNNLMEESLIKSSGVLSTDKLTTVCVFPTHARTLSDMATFGSGKIVVFFNRFDKYFKSGISHEYHHSVWTEKHYTEDYFMTVLDNIIMEGSAVMFETFVYPETNSTDYVVDESFNKEHWSKIETYLKSGGTNEFIVGGSKGLPDYYGYSEGYKMMKSYLNLHPDATIEEWTSKSPREIFEEGEYMANYE